MSETVTDDQAEANTSQEADVTQEAAAAQVDEFLAEFDESEPNLPEEPRADPDVKAVAGQVAELQKQLAAQQINSQISVLKERVRATEETFANLPDDLIDDVLDGMAKRDPRTIAAFEKSLSDPKHLDNLAKLAGTRLKAIVDSVATRNIADDVQAATSSARSIATSEPVAEPVNTLNMTDQEFRQHVKSLPPR